MKTSDIFNSRSAKKLNEGIEKTFGQKLNLESFSLQQLEDSRNRLRTQIYQIRSNSGFNDLVESESYTKAQWMLDAINSEIAERENFVADASTADVGFDEEVGYDEVSPKSAAYILRKMDDGVPMTAILDDFPELARMMDVIAGEHGLHPDDDFEQIEDVLRNDLEELADEYDKGYDDEGGETDDEYALASAGYGSDEDYESLNTNNYESVNQGEDMTQVRESATDKASAVVTAKTMVDRVGRWIEELAGMENDTLLSLGDTIRDEMGQEQAKSFLSAVAPAIQQALENLKATRETLATGVRSLTGEVQPAELIGADGEGAAPEGEMGPAEPDTMNAGGEEEFAAGEEEAGAEDEFAAAEPAAGGVEVAGRAQRESIDRSNQLLRVLAG